MRTSPPVTSQGRRPEQERDSAFFATLCLVGIVACALGAALGYLLRGLP